MAEEIDNHTIHLLQQMRSEMREMREDLTNRLDGNTLILNMLAGMLHDHEDRMAKLEVER